MTRYRLYGLAYFILFMLPIFQSTVTEYVVTWEDEKLGTLEASVPSPEAERVNYQDRATAAKLRSKEPVDGDRIPPKPVSYTGTKKEWERAWHDGSVVMISRAVEPGLIGAVAFDAAGSAATSSTASSLTYSFTAGGSADGIAVGATWTSSGTLATLTSITYGGQTLTSQGGTTQAGVLACNISGKATPLTGANNVVVTMSGNTTRIVSGAISVTGASASVPFGTAVTNAASSTGSIVNTDAVTNDLSMDQYSTTAGAILTIGADQTERWSINATGLRGRGSTQPGSSGTAMSWTQTSGGNLCHVATAFKTATAPACSPLLTLLGVGC